MDIIHKYEDFKEMRVGPRRREAVRAYLVAHKGIVGRIVARAGVDRTVVSKILHGRAVSAPVERAIAIEEAQYERSAA